MTYKEKLDKLHSALKEDRSVADESPAGKIIVEVPGWMRDRCNKD